VRGAVAALTARGRGKAPSPVTTADAELAKGDAAMNDFRDKYPVYLKPSAVEDMAQRASNTMAQKGWAKQPSRDAFEPYIGNNTRPITLNELQEARSNLAADAKAPGSAGKAAGFARDSIDDFVEGLDPSHVAPISNSVANLAKAKASLAAGQQHWFTGKSLDALETVLKKADRQDWTSHTGTNSNPLVQQIKGFANSKAQQARIAALGIEPDLDALMKGTTAHNIKRFAASALTGHNSFLPALLVEGMFGGMTGGLAGAATMVGSKALGTALHRNMRNAQDFQVTNILNKVAGQAPSPGLPPAVGRLVAGALAARQMQPQ
jgi:hypothetical protein